MSWRMILSLMSILAACQSHDLNKVVDAFPLALEGAAHGR